MKVILYITFLLLLLFSILSPISAQQKLDCEDLKIGRYYCSSPNGGFVYIDRGKRKQIEKYEDEKQRFIFRIIWLDDCSYSLTLTKAVNVEKSLKKTIIGTTITYYIIENKDGDHIIYFIDNQGKRVETALFENG